MAHSASRSTAEGTHSLHAPPLPTLPFDLISEILCRLPVKLLFQLQCECKSWNSLISDPKFIKKHLSLSTTRRIYTVSSYSHVLLNCVVMSSYSLDSVFTDVATEDKQLKCSFNYYDKDYYVVGSCNGILCIASYSKLYPVILLNPSTRELKELPNFQEPQCDCLVGTTYGFGYDSLTDNYKVVVVLRYFVGYNSIGEKLDKTEVKVHTLGTNFWRDIKEFPFGCVPTEHLRQVPIPRCLVVQQSGQFVSGTINWLASKRWFRESPCFIVSFDLGNESYQKVFLPRNGEEYGNKDSWIKLFTVSYIPNPRKYFTFTKAIYIFDNDHEVLLECSLSTSKKLMVYNSRNSTCKFIEFPNKNFCTPTIGSTEACVESLISPWSLR